jgi:hypothetical protein
MNDGEVYSIPLRVYGKADIKLVKDLNSRKIRHRQTRGRSILWKK